MSIYKKLHEVKKDIGAISKNTTNPFFKSKYFDINALIEHVDPLLQSKDLILLQPIKEGKQYSVIIDVETGEQVESYLELPNLSDPQKLGSCITYFRRYTLQSLLGLQAEDDDGNKARTPPKETLSAERFEKALAALKEGKTKKADILKYSLTKEQMDKL